MRNLRVTLDDGTAVVKDADVAIMPGEKVLVAGESGAGKSTLVRAIAGLWPWGEGDIRIRSDAKLFLLPQRPYIPIGTLRRAATYPDAADSRTSEEIVAALNTAAENEPEPDKKGLLRSMRDGALGVGHDVLVAAITAKIGTYT